MDKDTAMKLFDWFEIATFAFPNHSADTDQWIDENTPPTDQLPVFSVRLDAQINHTEDRAYRLRVTPTISGLLTEPAQALEDIAEQAIKHGVALVIQNNGVELS